MNRSLLGGGIAAALVLVSCGALPESGALLVKKFHFGNFDARMKLSGRRTPPKKAAPEAQAAQAILLRQEERRFLPGFDDNAFPAIYGEYRLETPGPSVRAASAVQAAEGPGQDGPPAFSVWISPMDLYYKADIWTRLAPINNYEARMRESEGRRLIALVIGTPKGDWTAVFSFPGETGTTSPEQNRIMQAFTPRFVYFLTFSRMRNDVSLPAVLTY